MLDIPMTPTNIAIGVMFSISGLMWLIVYIVAIYRGFKDKATGMPLFALGLNIGWEFAMSFIFDSYNIELVVIVCRLWVLADVILMIQEFLYGREDLNLFFGYQFKKWQHWAIAVAAIIGGFLFTYIALPRWNNTITGMEAAAIMNVSMSYLYCVTLKDRKSTKGQSIYVALAKLIGTDICGAIPFGILATEDCLIGVAADPFVHLLGWACLFFDVAYVLMLVRQYKLEGLNIWTRKPEKAEVKAEA